MAYISTKLLAVIALLTALSVQQKDPLGDFCRIWGHQTALVDRRLYIDGGMVNWNPLKDNPANYTSGLHV